MTWIFVFLATAMTVATHDAWVKRWFGHVVFCGWAISLTRAAYMISIKRLRIRFDILYGALWFREFHITTWFAGAAPIRMEG